MQAGTLRLNELPAHFGIDLSSLGSPPLPSGDSGECAPFALHTARHRRICACVDMGVLARSADSGLPHKTHSHTLIVREHYTSLWQLSRQRGSAKRGTRMGVLVTWAMRSWGDVPREVH